MKIVGALPTLTISSHLIQEDRCKIRVAGNQVPASHTVNKYLKAVFSTQAFMLGVQTKYFSSKNLHHFLLLPMSEKHRMRKCSFSKFLPRTGLEPNVHSSTLVAKQAARNVCCFKRGKRSLLYISAFNLDDSWLSMEELVTWVLLPLLWLSENLAEKYLPVSISWAWFVVCGLYFVFLH